MDTTFQPTGAAPDERAVGRNTARLRRPGSAYLALHDFPVFALHSTGASDYAAALGHGIVVLRPSRRYRPAMAHVFSDADIAANRFLSAIARALPPSRPRLYVAMWDDGSLMLESLPTDQPVPVWHELLAHDIAASAKKLAEWTEARHATR